MSFRTSKNNLPFKHMLMCINIWAPLEKDALSWTKDEETHGRFTLPEGNVSIPSDYLWKYGIQILFCVSKSWLCFKGSRQLLFLGLSVKTGTFWPASSTGIKCCSLTRESRSVTDHWRGRHSVHDQLPPCGDGEHASQTHQDPGLLDGATKWERLCYTQVSLEFTRSGDCHSELHQLIQVPVETFQILIQV